MGNKLLVSFLTHPAKLNCMYEKWYQFVRAIARDPNSRPSDRKSDTIAIGLSPLIISLSIVYYDSRDAVSTTQSSRMRPSLLFKYAYNTHTT